MTLLINPNDDEIKQQIIKCYEIIYENNDDYKIRFLQIVDKYCNNFKNIDKNELIDYIKLRLFVVIFNYLNEQYQESTRKYDEIKRTQNEQESTRICDEIKIRHNNLILKFIINTSSYNSLLYEGANSIIVNFSRSLFNSLCGDEYLNYLSNAKNIFIYFSINKLFNLNNDNQNNNKILNKSIEDLKDNNKILNKFIEDLKDKNESLNKSIEDLKNDNKNLNIKINILLITTTLFIIKKYVI